MKKNLEDLVKEYNRYLDLNKVYDETFMDDEDLYERIVEKEDKNLLDGESELLDIFDEEIKVFDKLLKLELEKLHFLENRVFSALLLFLEENKDNVQAKEVRDNMDSQKYRNSIISQLITELRIEGLKKEYEL